MEKRADKSEKILSHVNLFAVLKAMEELVRLDPMSRDIIGETRLNIAFTVAGGGPRGWMSIADGTLEVGQGRIVRTGMHLRFVSPSHFNRMVDGKALPIPTKGIAKIGFLTGTFSALAKRLEFYLRADSRALEDDEIFRIHTRLLGYVAFHALSPIANRDRLANSSSSHIPDGDIQLRAGEEFALFIRAKDGVLESRRGYSENARCSLWFADLRALFEVLTSGRNIFDLIGLGRAGMDGFIPMVDYLNPVLDRIPAYVS
jgi:hypothetical protein